MIAMRTVFLSLLVWMLVLSVLSLHFFMGVLEYRCVDTRTNPTSKDDVPIENGISEIAWSFCGFEPGSSKCPPYQKCVGNISNNPDYGYQNYNDIGWSYLMTIRLVTRDFWEDTYHNILLTKGLINIWYFPVITFSSSCFLALLFAVIFKQYASREKSAERKGFNFFTNESVVELPASSPPQGCWSRTTDLLCLWNCCRCWEVFSGGLRKFIFHPFTETFTALIIIITIFLNAMRHDLMDEELFSFSDIWHDHLDILFILEAIVKILALSPKGYFSFSWNIFEFCVTFHLAPRILMFVRLGRYWPSLNFLYSGIGQCLKEQFQFLFIYGSFFLLVAWIGTETLGRNYTIYKDLFYDSEIPRWNFVDWMHSYMNVFRILCGEWIETMYDSMRVNGFGALLFYFTVLLIGKYLMVNVFIVFMVGRMESSTVENTTKDHTVDDIAKFVEKIQKLYTSVAKRLCISSSNGYTTEGDEIAMLPSEQVLPGISDTHLESVVSDMEESVIHVNPDCAVTLDHPPDCWPQDRCNFCTSAIRVTPNQWNTLRGLCLKVSQNWVFEVVILIVVAIGCIPIAIQHYESVREAVGVLKFIMGFSVCIPVLFVLEMTIKLFGYGLSYCFQSGWRTVDLIIVLIVFLNMLTFQTQTSFFKILQSLQVFRLFRVFRYLIFFHPFRVTVNTLLCSIPGIVNMLIVGCMMWLMCAVLSIQLFGSMVYGCVDDDGKRFHHTVIENKQDCENGNHFWIKSSLGFQNIFESAVSLFHVGTFNGWIEVIQDAVDAPSWVDDQPITERAMLAAFFFFLFICLVTVFIYSTLTSLLLDSLNKNSELNHKQGYQGTRIYENVLQYIESKTVSVVDMPIVPFRAFLHQLTSSLPFKLGVANCIVVGVIIMACYEAHGSELMRYGLNSTYVVLVMVLLWELLVRLLATNHPLNFFCSVVNALDTLAFILGVADVSSGNSVSFYVLAPLLLRLPRLAQIFWSLPISRVFMGLRRVRLTLSRSLSYIASIFLITFSLIFVYSLIGVNVFHNVTYLPNENFLFNFGTLGSAMIIMYQISTNAGFDSYYIALSSEQNCDMYDDTHYLNSCGHALFGAVFLISFIVICYIVCTLVPVVIVKQYKEACDDIRLGLAPDDLEEFYKSWAQYDPMGQGFLPNKNLPDLLDSLSGALRLTKPNNCQIALMDVPVYSGQFVYHREVLAGLARRRILQWGYKIETQDELDRAIAAPDMEAISSTLWRAHEVKCAINIQAAWRMYRKNSKREA